MKIYLYITLLAACCASAQITNVNIGTNANTGSGDPLRTAFIKLNTNDTYLLNEIIQPATNTWAGPTNGLTATNRFQYYSTLGDCSITGYVGIASAKVPKFYLTVLNTCGSNVNLYLPAGTIQANGASGAVWVTNSAETEIEFSVRSGVRTNAKTTTY